MIFHFSGLLLRFVDYERTVTISAANLGEALGLLRERYPRLKPILWDRSGQLTQVHRLIINGKMIADPSEETALAESDRVEFLTAVAGG